MNIYQFRTVSILNSLSNFLKKHRSVAIIFLLTNLSYSAYCQEIEVVSKITSATIYSNGANVQREAEIKINSGKSILKFIGITKQLNSQSLQLNGEGDFTILSVKQDLKENSRPTSSIAKLYQDSIDQILNEMELNKTTLSILKEEEIIL